MGRFSLPTPETCCELRDWTDPCIEPTLTELLADPMMDLVFRSDKLRRENVENFLRDHAIRLAAERPAPLLSRCA
ncbi:MAG: hypothetical protein LWW93_14845 [Hyphomicrobiales bacterium]|nr:hypothetical protein [Hyphomicrobiales bacterium]